MPKDSVPSDSVRSSGVRVGIVIPTINRGDLLAEGIASLIAQENEIESILIIDNGGQNLPFEHPKIEIVEPGRNLGVAASWNLGVARLFEIETITHVLTLNDDIVLGGDQVGTLKSTMAGQSQSWFFVGPYYWSVWAISREAVAEISLRDGYLFDEAFYPAYYEDNDFYHRFTARFPDRYAGGLGTFEPVVKRNSASAARDPSLTERFQVNGEYFLWKWGGMPGQETRHPDTPLSIAFCYETHCERPSDINEHLPTLRHLAGMCPQVTVLGVGTVATTWAFLHGEPRRVICYDVACHSNVGLAARLAEETGIDFEFHEADDLTVEVEPTDLLFIDTLHTYAQRTRELNRHASKVQKCIVMHDTVSFGYRDEVDDGEVIAKRGLVTAIVDFLESPEGREWEHYGTDMGNNGLTILVRRDGDFDPGLA